MADPEEFYKRIEKLEEREAAGLLGNEFARATQSNLEQLKPLQEKWGQEKKDAMFWIGATAIALLALGLPKLVPGSEAFIHTLTPLLATLAVGGGGMSVDKLVKAWSEPENFHEKV